MTRLPSVRVRVPRHPDIEQNNGPLRRTIAHTLDAGKITSSYCYWPGRVPFSSCRSSYPSSCSSQEVRPLDSLLHHVAISPDRRAISRRREIAEPALVKGGTHTRQQQTIGEG